MTCILLPLTNTFGGHSASKRRPQQLSDYSYLIELNNNYYDLKLMMKSSKSHTTHQTPTVFIVGPTASGKSHAGLVLAQEFNGAIICADSQTVRRKLDIGTAKPSKADQKLIPHYILDAIEPFERYSVAQFKKDAEDALEEINQTAKTAFVVGGTGLYVDALYYEYELDTPQNIALKNKYETYSIKQLQTIIKERGYKLPQNENNPRHLIGLLMREGVSPHNRKPRENSYIYGILPTDAVLRKRINNRIDDMFAHGIIEEVQRITEIYGQAPKNLDAIGYPLIQRYLLGDMTLEETKEKFKRAHWQYARRQKTWFRRNKSIQWFSSAEALVVAARIQLASQ